jgi:DNA polymerase III epsilon subunit-like protein
MIDMETLGTHADAVILSIGAVKFDLDSDNMDDAAFYASISIDSNLDAKRRISESTLLWWLDQAKETQEVFREPKQSLKSVLTDFAMWFDDGPRPGKFVWSNGADFDIAMLAHAYSNFGMDTPWNFYDARCVRTLKNLPGMKTVKAPNALKHNALQDAIAQTKLVQTIQKKLTAMNPHPMVKSA